MISATDMYVIAVIFLAALIRSTVGFGEALVAVPLLALRIPVAVAVPLAVLVSVIVAATVVVQDWRYIHFRSAGWLVMTSLAGIPLGLWLLLKFENHLAKMILGLLIAGFASVFLLAKSLIHLKREHTGWLVCAGFISGVLGGAYGINGPPLVIYGILRRWSPQHFRATLQGYFLPVSLVVLVSDAALGLWQPAVTRYFLVAIPGLALAMLIGRYLHVKIKGESFYRCVYVGLLVSGGLLFLQGYFR